MEDYAHYLASEAKSDIAALHQFKILYSENLREIHFFFEGAEDSLFYMPEARRFLETRIPHIYDCGGKKNVISVRDSLSNEGYDLSGCMFFIDRDYDDLLNIQVIQDEHTYITDFYSIENSLVCSSVVEILLTDVIRLSRADPEFRSIIQKFKHAQNDFYSKVKPIIIWVLAAKDAHLSGKASYIAAKKLDPAAKEKNVAPNLQNTNGFKNVMNVGEFGLVHLDGNGFSYFRKQLLGDAAGPPLPFILKWSRLLPPLNPKLWVRGKYEIWFFQTVVLKLLEETNASRKAVGGKVLRIPSALREGKLFELLGGRLPIPASLHNFLRSKLV